MTVISKIKQSSLMGAAALLAVAAMPSAAIAGSSGGGGGGGGDDFDSLLSEARGTGPCSVSEVSPAFSPNTFFVPSGGGGNYNILGWGNGTGGTVGSYDGMLERLASHCILVAAAETSSSGDGTEIRDAVNDARSRYSSILASNPRVCTSGHSQGGGGSFNAAGRLGADCVISVQADTVFTTRITQTLPADADVVALWSSADTLAPRGTNSGNTFGAARDTYVSIETQGESHFAPNSGTGGDIGAVQRLAAKALLGNDQAERTRFRQALYGPTTSSTVTTSNSDISYTFRNADAENEQP